MICREAKKARGAEMNFYGRRPTRRSGLSHLPPIKGAFLFSSLCANWTKVMNGKNYGFS